MVENKDENTLNFAPTILLISGTTYAICQSISNGMFSVTTKSFSED